MIEQEALKELFDYSPTTGQLIYKQARGKAKPGTVAGTRNGDHLHVIVCGERFPVRNLVWIYHHGEAPTEAETVAHINGNTLDNRIENLRLQPRISRFRDYEPEAFLGTLAYELGLLNTALLRHEIEGVTRVRLMRTFANLHKLPSKAK